MWITTLLVVGQCPAGSGLCPFVAKPGKTLNFVFGFLNLKNSIRYARTYWPLEMRLFCGGGCRGGARAGSPLWLDQTEARRAQKKFLKDRPPLISGSGWPETPPPPPLPFIWSSGFATVLYKLFLPWILLFQAINYGDRVTWASYFVHANNSTRLSRCSNNSYKPILCYRIR